ncbi:MAG TPA: SBBP repeat-containing protein, partial [Ignavibacteria bacterium]|nr:SBBP repeat-containing protein [Ignavibacteria bacterium]
ALLWTKRYNGTAGGTDYGNSIAVDYLGNVFVTGKTWTSTSNYDVITIKHNSSGDTVWTRRYNGPRNGSDEGLSICVDLSGNVYVTGKEEGTVGTHGIWENYITIKYNSAGTFLWGASYNGPGGDYDAAYSIAVDGSGNVYVTGESGGGSGGSGLPYQDYATIKYNSSGVLQWIKRYNGSSNGNDVARQLKIDVSGNVYVTGKCVQTSSNNDYATIKYNSAGTQMWVAVYTSAISNTDEANSLAVDRAGNVYVTGKSYGGASTLYDIATVKYNTSGVQVWVNIFNGLSNSSDEGKAITVDTSGNSYVTGYSNNITTAQDFQTIKYNSAGVQQWEIKYTNSGSAGSSDQAVSIYADNSGNVYAAGMSALDYAVVKYGVMTGIGNNHNTSPDGFSLEQNYPNPFNPTTNIQYMIAETGNVELAVYDVNGKEVMTLVNGMNNVGTYNIQVDASGLSSGVYFYKLVTSSFTDVKKMMLIK